MSIDWVYKTRTWYEASCLPSTPKPHRPLASPPVISAVARWISWQTVQYGAGAKLSEPQLVAQYSAQATTLG
jgi:hypothetical protein